jgi:NADH dehydrogenase FAD-containing subunit
MGLCGPLHPGYHAIMLPPHCAPGINVNRACLPVHVCRFAPQVVSPRNHLVFTPLLASTCVGTLEPRSVAVPLLGIQPALKRPTNYYYVAQCTAVHPDDRLVECLSEDGIRFYIEYDKLAVCTGSQVAGCPCAD